VGPYRSLCAYFLPPSFFPGQDVADAVDLIRLIIRWQHHLGDRDLLRVGKTSVVATEHHPGTVVPFRTHDLVARGSIWASPAMLQYSRRAPDLANWI
jgi:hypothetical protein